MLKESKTMDELGIFHQMIIDGKDTVELPNYILGRDCFDYEDIQQFEEKYLCDLADYDCFGSHRQLHFAKTRLPFSSDTSLVSRSFQNLTGEQWMENAHWGLIEIDFSLWPNDESIFETLLFLREFMVENCGNTKFVICNTPDLVVNEMMNWGELTMVDCRLKKNNDRSIGF